MSLSGDQLLLAFVGASMMSTAIAFSIFRAIGLSSHLKLASAGAFPAFLILNILYAEIWGRDPHGFVMIGIGSLVIASLPITILTTKLLARRFGVQPSNGS